MPKIKNYIKVTVDMVKNFWNNPNGNLYFRTTRSENPKVFEVVEGFDDYNEIRSPIVLGIIEVIWIEGPCPSAWVEVE